MRPTTVYTLFAAFALIACGQRDVNDDPVDHTEDPLPYEPVCEAPGPTACDNPAAMIRGTVRVSDDLTGRQGDLFLAIAHEKLGGGSNGGFFHTSTTIRGVDLRDGPVPFQLDMCTGSAMWSEDNCEYQLIAILDEDGDQGAGDFTPDEGELAGRVEHLFLSCEGDSPCLDVVLDCTDGASCVSFADSACTCADTTCNSDFVTCQ